MYLESRLVPGYERSVSASAPRVKTASPVNHATKKGVSIGIGPSAARTKLSRLNATSAAAATTPRPFRRTTNAPRHRHHRMNRWQPTGRVVGSWPSFPTWHAPRLLDPLVHLRSLRLLQGLHLDVAAPVGGSKRRRRVEVCAAEEDDIRGDVVGDHLDDPPEFWQPVVRLLPLDGILKPGDRLADQFVQPFD